MTSKRLSFIKKHNIAVLTTSSRTGNPRSIFVEINKVTSQEIILTDNEMGISKQNIIVNPQVFILVFNSDYKYLKIIGTAEYYNKGKYFDYVKKLLTNKDYCPKWAIVITIKSIKESC